MRQQPAPVIGGACSGSVAAAAPAPVVAGAAAGCRQRRWRRREQGEGKKVGGGDGVRGVSYEQPEANHTKTITRNIILSITNTAG
jgi:hypothetical protein